MIGYMCGVFDILRAEDLQNLDMQIQLAKQDGAKYFGLGIYEKELCENLGLNTPLKDIEDRMKIMEQIIGVDFVFRVPSLDKRIIQKNAEKSYKVYEYSQKIKPKYTRKKKYEIGYAPGTYDLFHAGHLENLMIASNECEKLIVGVKSDELVYEHKHRLPIMSAEERMEILRHFKFINEVYKYYTRDLHIANDWIRFRYGKEADAFFLGSDLKKDFADAKDLNIIYTPRDPKLMKTRSSSAYRKLHLGIEHKKDYKGNIKEQLEEKQTGMKDSGKEER